MVKTRESVEKPGRKCGNNGKHSNVIEKRMRNEKLLEEISDSFLTTGASSKKGCLAENNMD